MCQCHSNSCTIIKKVAIVNEILIFVAVNGSALATRAVVLCAETFSSFVAKLNIYLLI